MKNQQQQHGKTSPPSPPSPQPTRSPNDAGSLRVEGFVRITDPNTKRVYVETRA